MAESADALVSGTSALTGLWVRLPLWAQKKIIKLTNSSQRICRNPNENGEVFVGKNHVYE